jgi:hypothetical protein
MLVLLPVYLFQSDQSEVPLELPFVELVRCFHHSLCLAINLIAKRLWISLVFTNKINKALPSDLIKAATHNGLPATSIPAYVVAMAAGNVTAAEAVPGITPQLLEAGGQAVLNAYAYSLLVTFLLDSFASFSRRFNHAADIWSVAHTNKTHQSLIFFQNIVDRHGSFRSHCSYL